MGHFHVQIPKTYTIEEALASIPASPKAFIRNGLLLLSRVPENALAYVERSVIESIKAGYGVGDEDVATKAGLSREDARALIAATSLLATIFVAGEAPAEEFVSKAIQTKIVDESHSKPLLKLANEIAKERLTIGQAMARSRLARTVLPSITTFEVTVDLRLGFEIERVASSVPLAVVHLDTDAEGQEVWFQLTKREAQKVIEDLQGAVRQMEEAERWVEEGARREK